MGRKKEFGFGLQRDSLLNTQVINAGTKVSDRSAIKKGMKLMKRRLCFKILLRWEIRRDNTVREPKKKKNIYIYIYMNIYVDAR